MTRIDFYHDAHDKLHTAARIVHKAASQGRKVVLLVPDPEQAGQIDRMLWMHPPTGFVPHCRVGAPLALETPVLIASSLDEAIPQNDVLINLDTAVPHAFERFDRLVEIIGCDEEDKAPARERFRFYRDGGYTINRHDLSESSGNG